MDIDQFESGNVWQSDLCVNEVIIKYVGLSQPEMNLKTKIDFSRGLIGLPKRIGSMLIERLEF